MERATAHGDDATSTATAASSSTTSSPSTHSGSSSSSGAQSSTAPSVDVPLSLQLDDGLLVYRAVLCRCAARSAAAVASPSSLAAAHARPVGDPLSPSLAIVPLSDESSVIQMLTSAHTARRGAGSRSGSVSTPRDDSTAAAAAAAAAEDTVDDALALKGHGACCQRILLKSAGNERSMHLCADKLRYESVMQRRLAECNAKAKAAAAATTPAKSATPAAAAAAVPAPASAPCALPALRPHLRELSDFRLALVLPDEGGVPILQCIAAVWRSGGFASPPPLPQLPLPPASLTPRQESLTLPPSTSSVAAVGRASSLTTIASATSSFSSQSPTAFLLSLQTVAAALQIAAGIAEQLQVLHSCGLIHKALTPSSILYSPSLGRAQFVDLSSASLLVKDRAESHEAAASLHSSSIADARRWLWASPEQSGKANRQIDARSDLYSLGCVMHMLLTGRPPFGGSSLTPSSRLVPPSLGSSLLRRTPSSGSGGGGGLHSASIAATSGHFSPSTLDPLELIHMHLAKAPPSIIPASVTAASQPELHCALKAAQAIAEKLMQKQAEDRYQSAAGLLHDLRIVLAALLPAVAPSASASAASSSSSPSAGSASPTSALLSSLSGFEPGRLDQVSTFRLSQKLYGRETQVKQLREAYSQLGASSSSSSSSSMRGPRLFLLSGYSGVGKTSLVDELHQHLLSARGLFARGKFDLYKRDSTCFLSAFRSLCVQLLVQDAATWKIKLLRALGSNGAVLCDVLPELERLIGPQPAVSHLSPAESASRFSMVFKQFVSCVATSLQPLVLFLDDVQWCDSGSLALLRLLLEHESACLLIIGAYRDNEVDATHPLSLLIQDVKSRDLDSDEQSPGQRQSQGQVQSRRRRITEVKLQPLSVSHIAQMLVDSFRVSAAAAAPLAALLLSRTQGNPFHLSQLLASYHSSKLLWFDFQAGEWRWNLEVLQKQAVQPDVVELVCRHMLTLSAEAQQLLQYAACSGNRFTLHALQLVTQMSTRQIGRCACELEQAGMLLCLANAQDLLLLAEQCASDAATQSHHGSSADTAAASTPISVSSSSSPAVAAVSSAEPSSTRLASIQLQFAHDKIQAAAYQLIPAGEVSRVHCTIATQLMKLYDEAEIEEYALDIAGHINAGWLQLQNDGSPAPPAGSPPPPALRTLSPSLNVDAAAAERAGWSSFFAEPGMLSRVIELESAAGRQARAATAFDSALMFFTAALKLIERNGDSCATSAGDAAFTSSASLAAVAPDSSTPPVPASADAAPASAVAAASAAAVGVPPPFFRVSPLRWSTSCSLLVPLYLEVCNCLFLLSQYEHCAQCVEYVLSHVSLLDHRCQFFEIHVASKNVQQQLGEALSIGLAHVAELGITLMPHMSPELEEFVFCAHSQSIDLDDEATFAFHPFFELDEMTNPLDLLSINVLGSLAPAMWLTGSPLFLPLALTMVDHSRRKGLTPDTAFALSLLVVFQWPQNRLREVYFLGKLACIILERYGEAGRACGPRVNAAVLPLSFPWKLPLCECRERLEAALEDAIALSDDSWGTWLGMWNGCATVQSQLSLPLAIPKQSLLSARLRAKRWLFPQMYGAIWLHWTQRLSGQFDSLVAPPPPDPSMTLLVFSRGLGEGMHHLIMHRAREAVAELEAVEKHLPGLVGVISNAQFVFYLALALVESTVQAHFPPHAPLLSIHDAPACERAMLFPADYDAAKVLATLERVDGLIAKMRHWAGACPCNFLARLHLMQAERQRLAIFSHLAHRDLMLSTMSLYDAAAEGSQRNQFPLDAALSFELHARFSRQCHRMPVAKMLDLRAYSAYSTYGAGLKLKQLQLEHADVPFSVAAENTHWASESFLQHQQQQQQQQPPRSESRRRHTPLPSSAPSPLLSLLPAPSTSAGSNGAGTSASSTTTASAAMDPSSPFAHNTHTSLVAVSSSSPPSSARSVRSRGSLDGSLSVQRAAGLTTPRSNAGGDAGSAALSHASSVVAPDPSALEALSVLKAVSSFSVEKDQSKLLKKLMRIVLETAGATRGVLVLENANEEWCVELGGSLELEDTKENSPGTPAGSDDNEAAAVAVDDESLESLGAGGVSAASNQAAADTGASAGGETLIPSSRSSQASNSSGSTSTSSGSGSGSRLRLGSTGVEGVATIESALPSSVFQYVLSSMETLLISDPHKQTDPAYSAFASDPYFLQHQPRALLCMPVLRAGVVFGVLYLENFFRSAAFTSSHIQLLQLLCGQAGLSIDNARLYSALSENNASLEQQVHARTAELEEKNRQFCAAKEAAEAATKIKSDFLSNMSHEIRTPMNAVLGIGRLLADTSLTLEQQQYVQMINNSGHLLLTIINDILDFSKIEAGQLTFNFSLHNMVDVAETAAMLCYDMAVSKGLCFSWFIDPALPSALLIDSTRVQQILLNLLSNAIKFTRVGTVSMTITSTPSAQNVAGLHVKKHDVRVEVRDSGIGISDVQLSKLFRSFSQVQHVSGEFGGTGLGLVISKRLIEAMGGSIDVHSVVGEGSVFSFRLPCEGKSIISSANSSPVQPMRSLAASFSPSPYMRTRSIRPTSGSASIVASPALRGRSIQFGAHAATAAAAAGSAAGSTEASKDEPNVHGLLPAEVAQLSHTAFLFIGRQDAAASAWIRLLQSYGATVHTCTSLSEGHAYLLQQQAAAAVSAPGLLASPYAVCRTTVSSPSTLVGITICDLDSLRVSMEDACAQLLVHTGSLRILALFTSRALAPLRSSDSTEMLPQRRESNGTEAAAASALAAPMPAHAAGMSVDLSPLLSDPSALAAALSQVTHAGGGALTAASPNQQLAHCSLLRSLRKPFKVAALLRSLLKLRSSSLSAPESSDSGRNTPMLSSSQSASWAMATPDMTHSSRALGGTQSRLVQLASSASAAGGASPSLSSSSSGSLCFGPASNVSSPLSSASSSLLSSSSPRITSTASSASSSSASSRYRIHSISASYPLRILLAEDNIMNVKLMVMLLRKLGYEIVVAANGHEVLTTLDAEAKKGPEHELQVILMDASMDVMDGMECTRVIRAQQLPSRTRPFIIAQTANVTDQYRTMCLESGMDAFMAKPVQVEILSSLLQQAWRWHHAHAQTTLAADDAAGGPGAEGGDGAVAEVPPS